MLFFMLQKNFLCCFEMVGSFWGFFVLLINLVPTLSPLLLWETHVNFAQSSKIIIISDLQPMLFSRVHVSESLSVNFTVTSL